MKLRPAVSWICSAVGMATAVGIALTMLLIGSCSTTPEKGDEVANSAEAEKTGSGELRTEIDPLTKRFSVLGDSFEAKWMSGEFGDPRNPGPSTYWIDAVITLEEQQVAKLKSAYAPQPTDKSPSVVEGMRAHLPSGPYLASESLDDAFAEGGWWATAYLDEQSGDLVLEAMKGN